MGETPQDALDQTPGFDEAGERMKISILMERNRSMDAEKIANLLGIATALARIAHAKLKLLPPNQLTAAYALRTDVIESQPVYDLKALNKRNELAAAIRFFTDAFEAYRVQCTGNTSA